MLDHNFGLVRDAWRREYFPGMRTNEPLDDRIRAAYLDGATMVEVSELTGASMRRVRRVLHERDVPIRSGGPARLQLPLDEVAELYRQGLTLEEVAQRFGVSTNTIHHRLRDSGVERRRVGPREGWRDKQRELRG